MSLEDVVSLVLVLNSAYIAGLVHSRVDPSGVANVKQADWFVGFDWRS